MNQPVRRLSGLALAVVLALTAVACGDDTDASASRREVFGNLAHNVITPAYVQLDRPTAGLAADMAALCADPTPAHVDDARNAWADAWQAWNRTKAFRFGPLTDSRAVSDIGFMVDTEKIDAVISGAEPTVSPPFTADALGAAGADIRGLAAVEHVLFERDPSEPDSCSYGAAAAELVAEKAAEAKAAWTDGTRDAPAFAERMSDPGNAAYSDSQAVLDDLVNGMAMALTEATKELADAESAPPGERDTVGGHGGDRVRDTLWSVRALYDGDGAGDGVGALLSSASPDADERFRSLLARATATARALPADLGRATVDDIDDAYLRTRSLGTITRAELASILGVTLSLSDSDGDS